MQDVIICDNGVCVNGDCLVLSMSLDIDFGKVVVGMEVQCEMGDYFDLVMSQFFKGIVLLCFVKLGGLVSCCKVKGGGGIQFNNYMIVGVKMVVNEVVCFVGLIYVYDVFYLSDLVLIFVLLVIYGEGIGNLYIFGGDGNFSFYGIIYVLGVLLLFVFDLISFVIVIVIQVIMQYFQCDQFEQFLGLCKDQCFCIFVGLYCFLKVFGVCVIKKEGYCCYNSWLFWIINE